MLPLQLTGARREFVLDVINFYLRHPEERAAIGTAAGYDRLLGALAVSGPRS
ncbi:hypothetical protein GCM10010399_92160 [Dactylosporangium fulvum]|uniref:Uncharacterized protein n=1 Tax=Dactylosporangium fulvum TaxID=53359 RepID=A0ABY5VQ67_9ACTN|nr:hypothetical protein [Dactylosporangium fulvum]UWP78628.1 hypothetical protein Dfulv_25970 [Dactylosporangium fulvum]